MSLRKAAGDSGDHTGNDDSFLLGQASTTTRRQQKGLDMARGYQRKFPEVHSLASTEFISWDQKDYILVDVRTEPERKVSMIPGAIPLNSLGPREVDLVVKNKKKLVCYCTIGYRSGMEGTRLQHKYPAMTGSVYNLDGILNYTHASEGQGSQTSLIDPMTKQVATKVHNFANVWDFANQKYESVSFPFPSVIGRLLQVGSLAIWRFFQRAFHNTRNACKTG